METKTIKLKSGEYTNLKNDLKEHDIIFLTGARGSGKSYPTAKFVSEILENDPESKFIYMRINDKELATYESWCRNLNSDRLADESVSYKFNRGDPTRGDITLIGFDENNKTVYNRIIGKCLSLESAHLFKSGVYDEFKIIVFEEYAHLNMNPESEKKYVFNFLENVISIFRDRDKKIILLCNNLKTIPLLETSITELTGTLFKNPLKIKIFREKDKNTKNNFIDYINGERFDIDEFIYQEYQYRHFFTTKDFIIYYNIIYRNTYFIDFNHSKINMVYTEMNLIRLKNFLNMLSLNKFYYKNERVEREFLNDYKNIISYNMPETLYKYGSNLFLD